MKYSPPHCGGHSASQQAPWIDSPVPKLRGLKAELNFSRSGQFSFDSYMTHPIYSSVQYSAPVSPGLFSFPSQLSGATHVLSSPGRPLCGTLDVGRFAAHNSIRTACPHAASPLRLLHSSTFTLSHSALPPSPPNPFNATLTNHPTSVDSKQLTAILNPSESHLQKTGGEGGYG